MNVNFKEKRNPLPNSKIYREKQVNVILKIERKQVGDNEMYCIASLKQQRIYKKNEVMRDVKDNVNVKTIAKIHEKPFSKAYFDVLAMRYSQF